MNDLPVFVARPSGVWNTRTPLKTFILQSHRIRSDFSILTLAVARSRYLIAHRTPNDKKTSTRYYMALQGSGHVAAQAWLRYRDSWRAIWGKSNDQPSFEDVDQDLAMSLYAVRETSIARYSAIFETFVQCWALNMILAYLENGKNISKGLEGLAYDFSPFRQRYMIPTVPMVFKAFESINYELDNLPHINKDPSTGEEISKLVTPNLTAKSVVLFWRDLRNSVVHRDGLISHAFCNRHFDLFEELRRPYASWIKPLEPGTRLQLPDMVFPLMATTHYKTAAFLNEHLKSISEKRGHVQSENAEIEPEQAFTANFLLQEGDHPISLRWLNDPIWRNELLESRPRKWHTTSSSNDA